MRYSEMSDYELFYLALDKAGYILTDGQTAVNSGSIEEDLQQCFWDYADCLNSDIDNNELTTREMAVALLRYCR